VTTTKVSDPWAAAGMARRNGNTDALAAPIFRKLRRDVELVMVSLSRCGFRLPGFGTW
jgi:hypothetical protein